MKIDAVFLDVGGVVLEIDWSRTFEALGVQDKDRRKKVLKRLSAWGRFHDFERGKVSVPDFFQDLCGLFQVNLEYSFLQEAWNRLIVGNLPGIESVFDLCQGRVPVFALSNTNIVHYEHMAATFPISARFERFFSSFEVGARKPEREIYSKVAEKAKVDPHRSLFIDDLSVNVEAARSVGFLAHQSVNSPKETVDILTKYLQ